MWPTVPVTENNRLAGHAQILGFASLLLPLLALPAVVCAVLAWIKTLFRPSVPGRWAAFRAVIAAMILAPIGVAVIGGYWAHRASNLTNFGSGSQIDAMPVLSPGPNYTVVSSHVGSSGAGPAPTIGGAGNQQPGIIPTQLFAVSNQTSLTT
jgi:hypothetical protein